MDDYGKIVTFVDRLHKDLHALVVLAERLMLDRGYTVFPTMGNRVGWGLTAHMDRPEGWRLPNAYRLFMPEGADTFEQTIFYFINLESEIVFDFPPVICGRLLHPPLTENQVWSSTFYTSHVASLARQKPAWQNYSNDRGWTIAEPAHKTLATGIRFYLLNLFDLKNQASVLENVVIPLTEESALDEALTIPRHTLPGLR